MICFAAYSSVRSELAILEDISMSEVAFCSDDMWIFKAFNKVDALRSFLEENISTEILCFDITVSDGIETVEAIRNENKKINIMLIADAGISPISYMKPAIMASSLLLRPFSGSQIKTAVHDMITEIAGKKESEEDVFILKQKEGNLRIPFSKIFFFEAREKKIFVNTLSKEYAFYDTLENLSESLPKGFKRSHKGFIVNTAKIERVYLSQNFIELEKKRIVPLSRSYKKDFK